MKRRRTRKSDPERIGDVLKRVLTDIERRLSARKTEVDTQFGMRIKKDPF